MSNSLAKISSATSLLSLSTACHSAVGLLPHDLNSITKNVATALAFKLIYITPVDTTEALSNWQVGLMYPEVASLAPYFYGHDGITAGMSQAAAYNGAKAVISKRMPMATIYVSNNAPHIEELEAGKSDQQAAGFIETTVNSIGAEAQAQVRSYLNGD